MSKFKFPVDDTSDEVDDELEYYTDDSWSDYDPSEEDDELEFDGEDGWLYEEDEES